MPNSPLLGITQLSPSQGAKEVTINDAIIALESATNASLDVSFAASPTVTLTVTEATRSFLFVAKSGTAATTLNFPVAINGQPFSRILAVRNESGFGLTVKFATGTGSTVLIPNNQTRLLGALAGTNMIVAAEPQTAVSFVSLADTPNTLTGQAGKFISANAAGDALVFEDAAVYPSFANNSGRILAVNSNETGVEWVSPPTGTFEGLTDTPSAYTNQGSKLVAVKQDASGLEFVEAPEAEAVEFASAALWRIRVLAPGTEDRVALGEIEFLNNNGINQAGSGTATATTEDPSQTISTAFDGNFSVGNGWYSATGYTGNIEIQYDFGTPRSIRNIRLHPVVGDPEFAPTRFAVDFWNGSAWVEVADRITTPWVEATSQTFKINGLPLSSVADAPNNGSPYFRRNEGWEAADDDETLAANSASKVATQRAIKTYVDSKIAGLRWKQPARAATTANVALATALENGDTIDGVVLATGNRILVKNQTNAAENGIYIVAASGAPTRSDDGDSSAELVSAAIFVSEGSVNADKQFVCQTNAPIVVGTTALTFAEFQTGGGGTALPTLTGNAGRSLRVNTGETGVEWVAPVSVSATSMAITGTASNLDNADANKYLRFTNAAAKTLTIRPQADHAITQDSEFHIRNVGDANLTLEGGVGVTINPPFGGTLVVPVNGTVTLKRVAQDIFDLLGQTVPA